MSTKLDDMLKELADAGNFSHLSIVSSTSGFHATFMPAIVMGRGQGFHETDPVKAALMAIDNQPTSRAKTHLPASRVSTSSPPLVECETQASAPRIDLMELFNDKT